MSNEGHNHPNSESEHPISARLEHVRTEKGFGSLRAFYRELSEGWDDPVSYEAVRNYHKDREPPPSYLARVSEVFGYGLAWLVADKGPKTPEEGAEGAASAGVELLEDVLSDIRDGLGPGADALLSDLRSPVEDQDGNRNPLTGATAVRRALAMHLWRRLVFTRRGQARYLDGSLGWRIGEALAGPFAALDVEPDDLPDDALTDYVQHATAALRALYPEPPEPSPSIRDQEDEE